MTGLRGLGNESGGRARVLRSIMRGGRRTKARAGRLSRIRHGNDDIKNPSVLGRGTAAGIQYRHTPQYGQNLAGSQTAAKPHTTQPAPTPKNDNLSLALAKTGHLPSIAHKYWLKRTSIDPSTIQYLIKSENPSGSPSLV
ncbi:hypothetical protein C8J57DRAFT_1255739 [Mycena rebaudengoi]|nr:hypothetical protein C8J57DRAFT_1255739 [Mycena rebaudengoi]